VLERMPGSGLYLAAPATAAATPVVAQWCAGGEVGSGGDRAGWPQ